MKRTVSALFTGAVVLVLGVLAGQTGLLRFPGPHLPDVNEVTSEVTVPDGARVVAIEPISLECRARVHAEVLVTATRRHQALGVVYRTDRVTLDAVGDVDARAITFVRPRVDAVASGSSLTDPGLVTVRVAGVPDFGQNESPQMGDGIELAVGADDVTCTASGSPGEPDPGARA